MNFKLTQIPERNKKPRNHGITMVMDKGLSIEEAKNFMSVSHPHVDIVKLGFGTAFVTPNLKEKLEVYRSYDMPIYFGGTLFEAFLIRNQFEDYISMCRDYGVSWMEVSDGSITIPHAEKCGYIEKLTKHGIVLSEVGSKDAAHIIPDTLPEGKPIIENGISLCKLHHSAYDSFILGVTPDYIIQVREDILEEEDGPVLQHGLKGLHKSKLILPSSRNNWPSREALEWRYSRFTRAG